MFQQNQTAAMPNHCIFASKLRVDQQPVADYLNQLRNKHQQNVIFRQLFHLLTWPKLLLVAAQNVDSCQKISRHTIAKVQQTLRKGYHPSVYADDNALAPEEADKIWLHHQIIQEAIVLLLQAIYNVSDTHLQVAKQLDIASITKQTCFSTSFGTTQVVTNKEDFRYALSGSLSQFASQIQHRKILQILQKRIQDHRFLALIWRLLRSPLQSCPIASGSLVKISHQQQGIAPYHRLFPLLIHICFQEFDRDMAQIAFPGVYIRSQWDWAILWPSNRESLQNIRHQLAQIHSIEVGAVKMRHLSQGIVIAGYRIRQKKQPNQIDERTHSSAVHRSTYHSVPHTSNAHPLFPIWLGQAYNGQLQSSVSPASYHQLLHHITQHFKKASHLGWSVPKTLTSWNSHWQRWIGYYPLISTQLCRAIQRQLRQQLWHYLKRRGYRQEQRYKIVQSFPAEIKTKNASYPL